MAFKVGDKVKHRTFGAGQIAFGPYMAMGSVERYLMKAEDGTHYTTAPDSMKPAAKFEVGDKVTSIGGAAYIIEAGPFFTGYGAEWYAVRGEEGGVYNSNAGSLEAAAPEPADKALKPGDVVRISRDGLEGADVKAGDLLVVTEVGTYSVTVLAAPGARNSEWFFDHGNVERVDPTTVAVVDNVAYDLTARYKDRDGDVWTFKDVDGTVRGECRSTDVDASDYIAAYSDTLWQAVRNYGPLTRV
ncbi:phiSA1p31-related protein [Streptomyces sp. ISL-12]|uniref:phiSA1p31-related protein n=1 Tax=Streptomyces sp. ISL-12 TaxID=2819177 RepID=UPI001BEA65F1|nr:phiSA1p31-related protein [Streptomyces sp. ISL-12]MBT2412673.1 phiSA1p31-related protein [Streptomyces sp. ISL-12]